MSDADSGTVEWRMADKFVMPVIPEELAIDPVLLAMLHACAFFEISGDETVDPDWAVEAMEHMTFYLQRLTAPAIEELRIQFDRLTSHCEGNEYDPRFTDLVRNFLQYAGLHEED